MALIALSGIFFFPPELGSTVTGQGFASVLLDSANEASTTLFQFPVSGTISKVGFRTTTISTGAVVDVRLETVSAGSASGTLLQSSSNVLLSLLDTNDNVYFTMTLGSGTVVDAGSVAALAIRMNATSAGVVNIARINTPMLRGFPYANAFLGNVWTKSPVQSVSALEYSDGSYPYVPGLSPMQGYSSVTYTTGAAGVIDERGIAFSFPFPVQARGFWCHVDFDAHSTAILYDADTTTILRRLSLRSDNRSESAAVLSTYFFASAVTFLAASTYRLTFVPDPGGTMSVSEAIGSSTAVMTGFAGYPAFLETFRADSGAWTENARVYPFIGLQLSAFDDAAQVGGITAAGVWGF